MARERKARFEARIRTVQQRMVKAGIDVLIIPSPENMHYLTGYDGWNFYLHQCIVLAANRATPLWVGRGSDLAEAKGSPVIDPADVYVYGDSYIQSQTMHPYEFVAERIIEHGWGNCRIGVPMDAYYFSAQALSSFKGALPNAEIVNDGSLINWVRAIKSPDEIEYMRTAGSIAANALVHGAQHVKPGLRSADTAAAMLSRLTVTNDTLIGGYSAIAPLIINGEGAARPHTTWSDAVYDDAGSVVLEIAGVYQRYHCPIARTVSIGAPPSIRKDAAAAQAACLKSVEQYAVPGISCGELAQICADTLHRHGFQKAGRFGYSTGLAYPPDWGEHTVSVRADEETLLEENMTLFFIPGLWGPEWSVAIGETFQITQEGARPMTGLPYGLIVRD